MICRVLVHHQLVQIRHHLAPLDSQLLVQKRLQMLPGLLIAPRTEPLVVLDAEQLSVLHPL